MLCRTNLRGRKSLASILSLLERERRNHPAADAQHTRGLSSARRLYLQTGNASRPLRKKRNVCRKRISWLLTIPTAFRAGVSSPPPESSPRRRGSLHDIPSPK